MFRQAGGHRLSRAYQRPGQATSALLADSPRFFDGREGQAYSVERATELKQEGAWDGAVTLMVSNVTEDP